MSKEQTEFNFTFPFVSSKNTDGNCLNCIYCKCKDDEIKILKKQNKKNKNEIIDKDKKIKELQKYINDFINFSNKHDINNINKSSDFLYEDLMYIDFDVFNWECTYSYKKQIEDYEDQLETIDNIFINNNVKSLEELKSRLSNTFYDINKYNKILNILENVDIKIRSQKIKEHELINNIKDFDKRIEIVKTKVLKLKPNTIIEIGGIKKIYKCKIEKVNIFKMVEQEFNEYCEKQIAWAKSIIGNTYDDNKIINLLDILNKLNKNYNLTKSESENEICDILDEMENIEVQRYNALFKLGKSFINKNITDKSQIPEIINNYKKIIYSYDSKDKINRFISTSKRMYKLSNLISTENIIKSKCMTSIRDMNNKDFDCLLILLENKNQY